MSEKSRERNEEEKLWIPRGGPLYVQNVESGITSVNTFQSSVIDQLHQLSTLCSSTPDFDLSIDELKVYTDEELVDMALKEVEAADSVSPSGHDRPGLRDEDQQISEEGRDKRAQVVSGKGPPGAVSKRKSMKRKKMANNDFDGVLIEKVEQLAKIKQKQDEDRAAARLHSLSLGCEINESADAAPDGTEITKTKCPPVGTDRIKALRSISSSIKVRSSGTNGHKAVQYPEVVLCVEVFHSKKSTKNQEFLVLGRQTLTELRDNILCVTDLVMQKAGEHDPSGYFLIEDVFYNDLRNPSAINYSEPIFDWFKNSKEDALKKWEYVTLGELKGKQKDIIGHTATPQMPRFKALDMHKTRFCDLKFRLGAGYLYCHQGDCKHTIVIRDMRLIHPDDVCNKAVYPLITFQLKIRVRKCDVCKIYRAKMVTVDDKWAQENPCYFCENCYYLLHHSSDGSLLYDDFSVYEYIPD